MAHCPASPLAAGQVDVSHIGPDTTTLVDPGAGNRRGVVLWLHQSVASDTPRPYAIPNIFGVSVLPLSNSLVADGWVFAQPNYPGDWSIGGVQYITNWHTDVSNDAGHGSRLVNTFGLWLDHWFTYQASLYGANRPTIIMGFSEGAYVASLLASTSSPSGMSWPLIGYAAHCPVTLWENVAAFQPSINCSGMDLSTTQLNAVTIPGIIGLSDNDSSAGWALSSQAPVLGMTYQGGPQSNGYLMASNAIAASRPVTIYPTASSTPGAATVAYPNGHLFLSALSPTAASLDAAHYAAWVASTLDPSHPVSF